MDVARMIKRFTESDYDLLGATYFLRDETRTPLIYDFDKEDKFQLRENVQLNKGIVDCDATGFGFLCMKPKVVRELRKVYGKWIFHTSIHKDTFVGEDVFFFRLCKEAGFKIGVNTDWIIGHYGITTR